MRWMKAVYVAAGLALLAWILAGVDLDLALDSLLGIGWGLVLVLFIYLVAFHIDTMAWHLAILRLPLTARWSYVVWRIRMVGEAFNMVLPAGGFGGEPLKAVLLKEHHAVSYREGTASIILARTVNLIALVGFMLVGLIILADHEQIPEGFAWMALGGFAFLAFGIGVVFAAQRYRVTSATGSALMRTRLGRALGAAMESIRDVEDRLHHYYLERPKRFLPALTLSFLNWVVGALETYAILHLLGQPVSFAEAWMIEAVAQMVRAVTFFVPANLGTQDGIFILLCAMVTGKPEIGVAVAAVKRLRELIFVIWGFALGSMYSVRGLLRKAAAEDAAPPSVQEPEGGPTDEKQS